MGGGKRGAKIRFFQNGKVEQVSFKYAWRKHDFGRIEDLPFLDWFWKFYNFFCDNATCKDHAKSGIYQFL